MVKRNIISISALKNSYTSINRENKHLSPLYGAMMTYTGTLERLYDINASTATTQLIRALFYKRGEYCQFKESDLKTSPAYSLTPIVLAHILHHLTEGSLTLTQTKENIYRLWREQHYKLTGNKKISKSKIGQLINWITLSQKECMTNHYLPHTTEYVLLGFLHFKSKDIEDINNYISTLNLLRKILNKKNTHFFYPPEFCQEPAIYDDYEDIVISAILSGNHLEEVICSQYGYLGRAPKTNCFETAMHNLLNILLYNDVDNKFDFNLLPSALKPNHILINFYQDLNPSDINLRKVGQDFMNMVSGHTELIYCADYYELDTLLSNFIKLMNLLFGIVTTSFAELSFQFSDDRRQVQFHLDSLGIRIDIKSKETEVKSHLFYLDKDHAELRTSYFKQNESKLNQDEALQQIIQFIKKNPSKHFMLLSVLYKAGSYINIIDIINDPSLVPFLYFLFPKTTKEAYEFVQKITTIYSINLQDFKDYLFYFCKQYDDFHIRHFLFRVFIKYHFDRDNLKIKQFCISFDPYYYLVEKFHAANADGSFSKNEMLDLIKETDVNIMLIRAIRNDESMLVKLLLIAGANPNPIGIDGDIYFTPPLFEALISIQKNIQMIKILLESGANLNVTSRGKPPLHFLLHSLKYKTNIDNVYYEAIRLLLEHGASLLEKDDHGLTPLEITEEFIDAEIHETMSNIFNECTNEIKVPRFRLT